MQTWERYNASAGPPLYDFSGEILHNSNSAMVGSMIEAGRPDVASHLMNALEPPARMRELEARGLSPEQATDTLALERKLHGLPSSPGASHPLPEQQIRGLATSEPSSLVRGELLAQFRGAITASGVVGFSEMAAGAGRLENAIGQRVHDAAFPQEPGYLSFVRMKDGVDTAERHTTPFQQSGRIIQANDQVVVQSVRGGETLTYRTQELLGDQRNGPALQELELAASRNQSVDIRSNGSGIDAAALAQSMQAPSHQQSLQQSR